MLFRGFSRTFSTIGSGQYNTIGAFWDEMSALFGRENLYGLGYNWTDDTIEYVIGLKNGQMGQNCTIANAEYKKILLPDENWEDYRGRTDRLSELYDEIYRRGPLQYEIETFREDGTCHIKAYRCIRHGGVNEDGII